MINSQVESRCEASLEARFYHQQTFAAFAELAASKWRLAVATRQKSIAFEKELRIALRTNKALFGRFAFRAKLRVCRPRRVFCWAKSRRQVDLEATWHLKFKFCFHFKFNFELLGAFAGRKLSDFRCLLLGAKVASRAKQEAARKAQQQNCRTHLRPAFRRATKLCLQAQNACFAFCCKFEFCEFVNQIWKFRVSSLQFIRINLYNSKLSFETRAFRN